MTKTKKALIAGILGISTGFILGTILAPCSGEEMQKKIGIKKRTPEEKIQMLESKLDKLEEQFKKDKAQ